MARQQLNDEEIKAAIAARFGCHSNDVILTSKPVTLNGHWIGDSITASVPVKDELDTARENIKKAMREIGAEVLEHTDVCGGDCTGCGECKNPTTDENENDYVHGLAVAAAIFAESLGIEVADL
jgi:hypothetical protein